MRKQPLSRLFGAVLPFIVLPLSFALNTPNTALASDSAIKNPVTLKATLLVKRNHPVNYVMTWLAEQVEKRSTGKLNIKILGGPEAVPDFEQTDALLRGVIDLYWTGSAYIQPAWPEAITFPLSKLTPAEERKKGAFDLLQESAKKKGIMYLGRTLTPRGYYMYLNVRVKGPDDLKGLKIRGAPIYARFIKGLGASMVTTPFGEVYTAMENKLIDGYCWPPSVCEYRLQEVTKYVISQSFYGANSVFAMNLQSWNKLPDDLKKLLLEAVKDQEDELAGKWREMWNNELQDMKNGKMEFLNFSPDGAKRYLDLAYGEAWKEVLEKSPDYGPKLMKIMIP